MDSGSGSAKCEHIFPGMIASTSAAWPWGRLPMVIQGKSVQSIANYRQTFTATADWRSVLNLTREFNSRITHNPPAVARICVRISGRAARSLLSAKRALQFGEQPEMGDTNSELFAAQSDNGVDAGRSSRRKVRRCQCDQHQQKPDTDKC